MITLKRTGLVLQESNEIIEKTNDRIEFWCRIIHAICLKFMPPICMAPQLITCFFNYFTTDLGNDSFEMQFPVW